MGLPTRIILTDGSGHITLDALDWLAEQECTLIRLTWDGLVLCSIGATARQYDPELVKWQLQAKNDERQRVEFAAQTILAKVKETQSNLELMLPSSTARDRALVTTQSVFRSLEGETYRSVPDLLGLEGKVAAAYFAAWRHLAIKWQAEGKHPIQEEWRSFTSRRALNQSLKVSNRNATHPINAMLNYAYKLLEGHVRIGVIAEGYDPDIGVVHKRTQRSNQAFVFDLIEPLRPVVDRVIIEMIATESFTGADFLRQSNGTCRLSPDLARALVNKLHARL